MGESVEEAGFFLPSEFFTDDDFLIDKQNLIKNNSNNKDFNFPYHTEKNWVISTSPPSTLTRFPSPPTTPLSTQNDAVGDLIYQVSKFNLNQGSRAPLATGFSSPVPQTTIQQSNGWYSQPVYPTNKSGEMGRATAWAIKPTPTRFVGSGTVKRERAGTGVFLPRRYGVNNNSDCSSNAYTSKNKTGFSATLIQNRAAAVDELTKSFNTVTGFTPARPVPQPPRLSPSFIQDYEILMARRQALLMQQRRNLLVAEALTMVNRDMYLPQEWSY